MVDREGLLEHLRALDEALRDWERYREKVSLRDLRSDRDARNMVLHAMLVAIQSAIDIASHLRDVSGGNRAPAITADRITA